MTQCWISQLNVFLIHCLQATGKASLCIVSMLPQQQHLTGPCQKQVFNISLTVKGSVALIAGHTQGQWFRFNRNQEKRFGFKKEEAGSIRLLLCSISTCLSIPCLPLFVSLCGALTEKCRWVRSFAFNKRSSVSGRHLFEIHLIFPVKPSQPCNTSHFSTVIWRAVSDCYTS